MVFGDDGSVTPYDQLIIATGSRAFMPPMDGHVQRRRRAAAGVFAFRTLDDTRAMVEYAQHTDHHRAVVIGGGLLGLEAARGLQTHGIDVDVVHSGKHLMNAQLGRAGGRDPAAQHGRARHRRVHRQPDHRGAGDRTGCAGSSSAT